MFQAQMTYSLENSKELSKSYPQFLTRTKVSQLFIIAAMLYILHVMIAYPHSTFPFSYHFLLLTSFYWGLQLFTAIKNRNGDIGYKRMLSNNGGVPVQAFLRFEEDGIYEEMQNTSNRYHKPYNQVCNIYETKNLLVLVLEHFQITCIDKSTLTGGTRDAFLSFLMSRCSAMKKKKLTSLIPGKILQMIVVVVSICGVLVALWNLPFVKQLRHNALDINNTMTYRQIAQELEYLGITGCDDAMLTTLDSYQDEYGAYDSGDYSKAISLLCWLGMGSYNGDTFEWTPSSGNGVFWIDMEAMALDTMYTDFLRGIHGLDSTKLNFTDTQEDTDDVDLQTGTGTQSISFTWNGERYCVKAKVQYDWYDIEAIKALSSIIAEHSDGARLYFTHDQGQGLLIFYRDAAWAKNFTKKTGITLTTDPTDIYYGY